MSVKIESPTPGKILDAAERLVSKRGVSDLTLEAVAAEAGLSKGGLLYHFSSKEQLVVALVRRITTELSTDLDQAVAEESPGPGRLTRAILRVGSDPNAAKRYERAFAVLLATMVQDPVLLEPIGGVYQAMLRQLRDDGLPPGRAEVIVAAIDGLWMGSMFGLYELDSEHARRLVRDLQRLAVAERSEATRR